MYQYIGFLLLCNKWPQIQWADTTEIYCLTISVGSESKYRLNAPCSAPSSEQAEMKILAGAAISSKAQGPLSSSFRLAAEFVSLHRTLSSQRPPLSEADHLTACFLFGGLQESISLIFPMLGLQTLFESGHLIRTSSPRIISLLSNSRSSEENPNQIRKRSSPLPTDRIALLALNATGSERRQTSQVAILPPTTSNKQL